MFTEIIAVYSEIAAEYIYELCEQNSDNFKVVSNDTYLYRFYCKSLKVGESKVLPVYPSM